MLFQVKSREGKVLFYTESKAGVPAPAVRNSMRKAGLKLLLNGKPFAKGVGK